MMAMRDIKLLAILNGLDKTNPYKALSFEEIYKEYSNQSTTNASESTIRRSIKTLLENGYIEYGYKRVNVKTYYVTNLGIELISSIK